MPSMGSSSRLNRARTGVKISELDDRLIEIIPTKTQREIKITRGHRCRGARNM